MPGDTKVELRFIKPLSKYKTEKPYWLFVGRPSEFSEIDLTNVELETVPGIPLHDIRNDGESYTLDDHGFQFVKHDQTFVEFDDEKLIESEYLPQVEKVIRDNVPDAQKVFVFDWRIRQQMSTDDANKLISPVQIQDRTHILAPSQTVHADTTEFSLLKRVKTELPEEANELLKCRVQMINFWRPLYHEVQNWPLLVCDGKSTPLENLVAVDQIARSFVGDIYYATQTNACKWYYMSGMDINEGVLFKNWDTSNKAKSKLCLHSSCALPPEVLPSNYYPRLSIETRALVFSKQ
ncbi:hypothetical protein F5Y11DRAFT_349625 [Daldinia sp. FL1419]|nr:hypothetical protein F5Y11DRAFT_349625 [Daldinia sp. FL1419]